MQEMFDMMNRLFIGIGGLSWFVGICTLLAGVIGIGNIMLVIVRERTQGDRHPPEPRCHTAQHHRARSCWRPSRSPSSRATSVLSSACVSWKASTAMTIESDFFKNPEVDLIVALVALAVLIASGLFAGLLPAREPLPSQPWSTSSRVRCHATPAAPDTTTTHHETDPQVPPHPHSAVLLFIWTM